MISGDRLLLPALDADQAQLASQPVTASCVVVGAPGSGKTVSVIARLRALVEAGVDPDDVLVLTPSRQSATALRDRLALAVGRATAGPLARSLASFAFHIVRGAEVHAGAEPPQLLTGSDEDQIIHDLLEGDALDEGSGHERWPAEVSRAVRATRGFRSDLRAFLAQCTDLGIGPRELRDLGRRHDVPVWESVASFLEEYSHVRAEMRAAYRDAAGLVREATAILMAADAGAAQLGRFARLRCILVDDAQELTTGGIDLLEACLARGIAVMAWGDPDVGSGAFRGASPENFARLAGVLGRTTVLTGEHRGSAHQVELVRAVTARIGAGGVVAHRRPPAAGEIAPERGAVRSFLLRSPAEEMDVIARLLRERHVLDAVPWGQCAVIAHDSRQVNAIEQELAAREVPSRVSGPGRALREQKPVRDLLALVELAAQDPSTWTPEQAVDVLLGVTGGLDPVDLRRLRSTLRHVELTGGGERRTGELLLSALEHPLEFELLGTREAQRAARVAHILSALRADLGAGATAHELLWTAWSRSGLERPWQEAARGHGPVADQAGRDLDAVVALFQAAKRFGERQPDEPAISFVRGLLDSDVAEDRLDAPATDDAVRVLTPAAALGVEFDTVVIAGVQDGVWPNTRVRGGLLETWRLADAVMRPDLPPAGVLDRRRQALHDELRLFVRALSRARERVVVTAVSDDDLGPSVLFEMLPDPEPLAAVAQHPLSLRGLVAQHRRVLTTAQSSSEQRERAAGQLALLAAAGVAGAAPSEWYGLRPPTSDGPLRDLAREPVRVSPSRLDALEECQLDWVIADLGGDRNGMTAGIGTILHAAMETAESSDEDALWSIVESRWGELEFEAPWRDRAERQRTRDLVRRLALYLRRFESEGGRLLSAERQFEVPIDLATGRVQRVGRDGDDEAPAGGGAHGAVLSGAIDRVELAPDGRVVIVDLKTGKNEPQTDAKVVDNAQLAAYQLAFAAGVIENPAALPPGGAKLLVLRPTSAKDYVTPWQPPHDEDQRAAFVARVREAADVMRGRVFAAPYEEHCRKDHSYGLCRIHTVSAVSAS